MSSLGVPFISVRDGRYHGMGQMGPPGPPGKTGPKGITESVACNNSVMKGCNQLNQKSSLESTTAMIHFNVNKTT